MGKKLYGAAAAAHAKKVGRRSRKRSTAIVRQSTRTVYRSAPKRKTYRRRRHGGGGIRLTHLALASAGLAFVTGQSSPIAAIRDNAAKIPGAKTFGPAAAVGVACLAVDRFVKPNKWLKLLGTAGVVLAAVRFGEQGTAFKWVGDGDDVGYDLADDISDVDGDDDMGDDE